MNLLNKTVRDIKKIKIQGATNVAKFAVKAFDSVAQKSKAKTKSGFVKELERAKDQLYLTRKTEPLMHNILRYILQNVKESNITTIDDLKKLVSVAGENFLKETIEQKEKIAGYISDEIEGGDVVMTHCHSSSVTLGLIKAWKAGKKFSVICTETRPLFQGRKTAKELVEAGIPVTMIVDSAVSTYIEKVKFVAVGCDMITSDIDAVNKIGTLNLALGAKRVGIPFYVCTTLGKFDPETIENKEDIVEKRSGDEIWKNKPKGLKIENPAFDITSRELITSFITEYGVTPPASIYDIIKDKASWILHGF